MVMMSLDGAQASLNGFIAKEYPAFPGRTNHIRAGVLLPLQATLDGDLRCYLIQRTTHLRDHPGEVGFPGGKRDPADRTLADTALRETTEELGLSGLTVLGRLSSMPLFTSDYRLEPFVAAVPAGLVPTPSPAEVAEVLPVSLRRLMTASHTDAIPFTQDGVEVLSPVFGDLGPRPMYGGSAHVLWELLTVLGSPPPLRPGRYTWSDLKQA